MRLPVAESDWSGGACVVGPWSEGIDYKALVFGSGLGVVSCKI